MTPAGIRVFEGPISQRHSPSELVPLAGAKNVQPRNRTALAVIDVPSNKTVPAVEAARQTQDMPKIQARAKPSPQKSTSRSQLAMALE
ncbi:MAG TPA: hypothetical protein VG271_10945 [Beijerinckiaceae bacterium]|nr:hypothetical protein [Beijerinckiaceae bacterium]